MKCHMLHDFRTCTLFKEKSSDRSKDLYKLKLQTNFDVNLINQSASKHGLRTSLYSEMRELVCNGQLWANAIMRHLVVIKSDNERIFQQQFGKNYGQSSCYLIYFDSSTIVWLSRFLQQVSNDDTWACWCVIL